MGSETKDRIKKADNGSVPASNKTASIKGSGKAGLIKRLLKWIASESEHSRMTGGASCPT